jgi:nicotinate dehydrogenase subunit A
MPAEVQRVTRLIVNGSVVELDLDRDTPLLYVLRNDLGLKGTRFGCGEGLCGACTILIDGRAVCACDTPLWAADDRSITTVEGLAEKGQLGPVQQALLDARAGQCGYCLSGIVMRLEGALRARPRLDRDGILNELSRNLCRCGTHPRVIAALDALLAREPSEARA